MRSGYCPLGKWAYEQEGDLTTDCADFTDRLKSEIDQRKERVLLRHTSSVSSVKSVVLTACGWASRASFGAQRVVGGTFRGLRSFLASPPANFSRPFGTGRRISHGIERWLVTDSSRNGRRPWQRLGSSAALQNASVVRGREIDLLHSTATSAFGLAKMR